MSTNGLIGAAIGLVIAAIEYVTILAMFERKAAERMRQIPAAEGERLEQTLGVFRMVFRANFVLLPVLGYFLGDLLFT